MKSGLQVGQVAELGWVVDPSMTITLGGRPSATVFSTPSMILLMERSAREGLRSYLEEGEESVGVDVQIEHLAPAVLGEAVRGWAKVVGIDGRRIQFEVKAFAGERELGRGTHRRAVIKVDRLIENLGKLAGSAREPAVVGDSDEPPEMSTIGLEIGNRIARVTLNRPKALNAVDRRMTEELEGLVAWLAAHPEQVRVVTVTGAGDAFCAGDDVKELPMLTMEEARALSLRQAGVYLAFERLPQPLIAVVNGLALGAGCVLAYSCDVRVAGHSARFGMPEIRLGWPPGYGVAQLIALVGKARALELCLFGEPISAAQAVEWGLVNELVPGAMLARRAQELAERMLALPAEALRATKRLVHLDEGHLPKITHRADTEAYVRCLGLPDAQEGIRAFVEKRGPRFTGR